MRAALQVLHMLHSRASIYDAMPIDVLLDESALGKCQRHVIATSTIPPHTLLLPPCVPKATKLSTESPHPWLSNAVAGTQQMQPAVAEVWMLATD